MELRNSNELYFICRRDYRLKKIVLLMDFLLKSVLLFYNQNHLLMKFRQNLLYNTQYSRHILCQFALQHTIQQAHSVSIYSTTHNTAGTFCVSLLYNTQYSRHILCQFALQHTIQQAHSVSVCSTTHNTAGTFCVNFSTCSTDNSVNKLSYHRLTDFSYLLHARKVGFKEPYGLLLNGLCKRFN
jgi:hypothetical protein